MKKGSKRPLIHARYVLQLAVQFTADIVGDVNNTAEQLAAFLATRNRIQLSVHRNGEFVILVYIAAYPTIAVVHLVAECISVGQLVGFELLDGEYADCYAFAVFIKDENEGQGLEVVTSVLATNNSAGFVVGVLDVFGVENLHKVLHHGVAINFLSKHGSISFFKMFFVVVNNVP